MEEVVMGIKTRKDFFNNLESSDQDQSYLESFAAGLKLTGFAVAPNKAIVGGNAFRHESGIHQDGVLNER